LTVGLSDFEIAQLGQSLVCYGLRSILNGSLNGHQSEFLKHQEIENREISTFSFHFYCKPGAPWSFFCVQFLYESDDSFSFFCKTLLCMKRKCPSHGPERASIKTKFAPSEFFQKIAILSPPAGGG
jgi:hypothetical protein